MEDIINLILNPHAASCQAHELWTVSLNMALTLEEIWRVLNLVLHHKANIDIHAAVQSIRYRFQEYLTALSGPPHPTPSPVPSCWVPPPPGSIKINVNAAISTSKAAFAVVTRDYLGAVVKIWARILPTRSPVQAEIEALLWAV